MKPITILLAFLACQSTFAATRIEQNEPPEISHFPPGVAYRGENIPIYARVKDETGKIRQVNLYYSQSQQIAPIKLRMGRVTKSNYSGVIPAAYFGGYSKIWYFIEAVQQYRHFDFIAKGL